MTTTRLVRLAIIFAITALTVARNERAMAAPILSFDVTCLGRTKFRVEVFLDTGEPTPQAAGYTLNFAGQDGAAIQNLLFNGSTAIETQSEGIALDGVLGYSLAEDSWFDDIPENGQGLSNNFGPTFEGPNQLLGTLLTSSGQGETFKSGRIAHLIVHAPSLGYVSFSGSVAVAGRDYPQQGRMAPGFLTPCVPEPTAASLALLGLLSLGAVKRATRG